VDASSIFYTLLTDTATVHEADRGCYVDSLIDPQFVHVPGGQNVTSLDGCASACTSAGYHYAAWNKGKRFFSGKISKCLNYSSYHMVVQES